MTKVWFIVITKTVLFWTQSFPPAVSAESNPSPWTTEEQKLLEQALKTFPVNTPERWEKISDAVPGRSKKDCMKRYKVWSSASLFIKNWQACATHTQKLGFFFLIQRTILAYLFTYSIAQELIHRTKK